MVGIILCLYGFMLNFPKNLYWSIFCICTRKKDFWIQYSRLFFLGVNFPEFHNFILGCCIKFDCGLLIYIGWIWHEHNISLKLILMMGTRAPLSSKTLSIAIAATNIEVIASYCEYYGMVLAPKLKCAGKQGTYDK